MSQTYQFDIKSAEPIVLIGDEAWPCDTAFTNFGFSNDSDSSFLLDPSAVEDLSDDFSFSPEKHSTALNYSTEQEATQSDPTMALNVKNKVTPLSTTSRTRAPTAPKSGSAIFNVARVKKVELNEMPSPSKKNGSINDNGNNVLRKVASLTAGATTGDTRQASRKPIIVPEKLSFAAYEKFEGKWAFVGFLYQFINLVCVI